MAKVLGNLEIDNGNLGVNTSNPLKSIQVGGGSTSEVVRVYYSDASYIDITGFGLEMARAASYIRPNTDKNRSLYIGNDGKTWDTISHNANVTSFSTDTTEHMRINSSGNVGIGTTSPQEELEVKSASFSTVAVNTDRNSAGENIGSFAFYGHNNATTPENLLYSRVMGSMTDVTDGSEDGDIYFQQIKDGSIVETFRVKSNGNVGIGTTSPDEKLHIVGDLKVDSDLPRIYLSDSSHNPDYSIGNVNGSFFVFDDTNSAYRLYVNSAGNVGIGTSLPAQRLTVVDDNNTLQFGEHGTSDIAEFKIIADAAHDAAIYFGDTVDNVRGGIYYDTSLNNMQFRGYNNATRMIIDSDGKVGIGTGTPAAKLDVNGTAQMSTGITENVHYVGGSIQHWGDSGTGLYFETDELRFYTGGAEEMRLENDGDLHVDGDVIAYSTTVSDERLKDDIQTIDNACEKVCSLRGVEYTWNNGSRKGQREIGVIAQEVEKVIPEIVREKKLSLVDDEVYKTVDYEKLVAVLIEANKELCDRVSKLESKLDGITD